MTFVGNLLWFVFGGGVLAGTVWLLTGLLCCVTVVGIPLGIACLRIASFAYFPFGKALVPVEWTGGERVLGTGLANILWCVFAGFWLSLCFALGGVACCLTIVGIPFGLAQFKLSAAAFAPLGKRVVSARLAEELAARQTGKEADGLAVARKGNVASVLSVAVAACLALIALSSSVCTANPALFVRTDDATPFCRTVEEHSAVRDVSYEYHGHVPYVAVGALQKRPCPNLRAVLFVKPGEPKPQPPRSFWRRLRDRLGWAKEKPAAEPVELLIVANREYGERECLRPGRYVHLGRVCSEQLRAEAELPVYLDESVGYRERNDLLVILKNSELCESLGLP